MAGYLGDIVEDATIRGSFNTRALSTGAPITLAGTPALSVYKDGNVAQTTVGVTLTVDFDSLTGLHLFTVDTSADAFYSTGSDYRVVLTAGTVDGQSVVGHTVASFSIENRNTKANVTQMAANVITSTAIANDAITDAKVAADVTIASVTGSVGSVTSAVTVGTINANVITASSIATDAVTEIQAGLATALQVEQFVAASELNLESLLVDIPTVAEFNARSLPSADYFVVSDYTAPPSAATIVTQIEASTVLPTKTDVQNAGLI